MLKKAFSSYQGFLSQTLTTHKTAGEWKGTIFYSTLPLPPAHEHSDIFLQICMRDDYHISCIYQTAARWYLPLYRITICLIDHVMLIFVYLIDDLTLSFFYSNLTRESGGLELPSTIALVLQVNILVLVHPLSAKTSSKR